MIKCIEQLYFTVFQLSELFSPSLFRASAFAHRVIICFGTESSFPADVLKLTTSAKKDCDDTSNKCAAFFYDALAAKCNR